MIASMRSACRTSAFTRMPAPPSGPSAEWSEEAPAHDPGWGQRIDELLRMGCLKDDYDGEGSPAPHPALVHAAFTLARKLEQADFQAADRVIAGVNGTVYFEWHTPSGYAEIEVTSPCDAEYRWVGEGEDTSTVVPIAVHP